MIGVWHDHAGLAVEVFAIASTLIFAVPFIVAPARWGRAMRWTVPHDTALMAYYARCLGCLALSFNIMGLWAALGHPFYLVAYIAPVACFAATMVLLHVYGWWRGEQPWTETAEIPMWAGLVALWLAVMPPV